MIREAEEKDYGTYMELTKEFYESGAVLHPIPESNRKATWKEVMRSKDYVQAYILEEKGEPAGYGLVSKTFSQEAGGIVIWVEELYIRSIYRGRGLGREFFAFVEKEFSTVAARLRLEIEPANQRAKKLYEKIGYEILDYVQMVKERNAGR